MITCSGYEYNQKMKRKLLATAIVLSLICSPALYAAFKINNAKTKKWGINIPGVKTKLRTKKKIVALTLDACGEKNGSGFDRQLIEYLISQKVPATLFISGRYIDSNRRIVAGLAGNPLFEIENHGLNHRPLSVNGKSAYGIKGTKNPDEVFHEIEDNSVKISSITLHKPRYYRPGTAYCDDVALKIANKMGYEVIGFDINADAGATFTAVQVRDAMLKARPGSIIIAHMNHPGSGTYKGMMMAIPKMKKTGFTFVKLDDYLPKR